MDHAHEKYNWLSNHLPFKTAGKKILIIGTASIFALWFLFLFGPSAAKTVSSINLPGSANGVSPDLLPNVTCNPEPVAEVQKPHEEPPAPKFNESKVALLIEDRPVVHLAPLVLHMISVVPEDWKFQFVGSEASIQFLNRSLGVQRQEARGKLEMVVLPNTWSVKGQEPLSRTMTDIEFWKWVGGKSSWDWTDPYTDQMITGPDGSETKRTQVEWVLIFQTDSIMCANSGVSLNSWLDYDYVGAPWGPGDGLGGNGGLSIRRVSRIIQVLENDHRPENDGALEDLWLVQRLQLLPGAKMANGTTEQKFSVEQVWHDEPMGYHLGWSGARLPEGVWDEKEKRDKIWNWCPEIKLILNMRLEREGCPDGQPSKLKARATEEDWTRRLKTF
ncbi:unnamed protein product [Tuber aestivum]|uniref:DUF5672 domain-containing protein n=1 Tax=Tuber aestivum TaxID=59557 RepID=A0A292PPF0_9PEZI|nr:unnamed protein product [Tuber aestivum]